MPAKRRKSEEVKRRRPLEDTLLALRRVRDNPETEESRKELGRVLSSEGSHAVARAAAIVGRAGDRGARPRPGRAPSRASSMDSRRADPGCAAKTAIVEALRRLESDDRALYRRGAGHVQMEPVFGGRVDTAVGPARGLGARPRRTAGGDVLVDLANLLADPEPPVRISAARAVAAHGRGGGDPAAAPQGPRRRHGAARRLGVPAGAAAPRRPGRAPFVASFLEKDDECRGGRRGRPRRIAPRRGAAGPADWLERRGDAASAGRALRGRVAAARRGDRPAARGRSATRPPGSPGTRSSRSPASRAARRSSERGRGRRSRPGPSCATPSPGPSAGSGA